MSADPADESASHLPSTPSPRAGPGPDRRRERQASATGAGARVDSVPAGRRLLDGNRLVAAGGDLVRSRTKAIYNGAAVVTIVLEQARRNVRDVLLSAIGLVDSGEDGVVHGIRSVVCRAVVALSERHYRDDDAEAVGIAVRRECRKLIDKRPLAHVHLVRV